MALRTVAPLKEARGMTPFAVLASGRFAGIGHPASERRGRPGLSWAHTTQSAAALVGVPPSFACPPRSSSVTGSACGRDLAERELQGRLSRIGTGLNDVLDDLRELSRGLHPAVLSEDGFSPTLSTLALRSTVPVDLRVDLGGERFEEPVEVAAYYVTSEALTNTAKHAGASRVEVRAMRCDGWLELTVSDDGRVAPTRRVARGSRASSIASRRSAARSTSRAVRVSAQESASSCPSSRPADDDHTGPPRRSRGAARADRSPSHTGATQRLRLP
jgi:hypothetical protein